MNRTSRLLILAVCILVPVLALSACGTKKLKGPELAKDVKSTSLAPLGITTAKVKCPAETEAKKGKSVRCTVTQGKEKGSVTGTFDNDGNFQEKKAAVDDIQVAVIEKTAAKEAGKGVTSMSCANTTKPKEGAVFTCFTVIPGSGLGQAIVRQTGPKATDVAVKLKPRRLTTRRIESTIAKTLQKKGINPDVQCPGRVRSQVGGTFDCKVTNPANGKQITVEATQKDAAGNFKLRVK